MQRVPVCHWLDETGATVVATSVDGISRGALVTPDMVCDRCGRSPKPGDTFTATPQRDFSLATWEHSTECPSV